MASPIAREGPRIVVPENKREGLIDYWRYVGGLEMVVSMWREVWKTNPTIAKSSVFIVSD